jgi:hypothetical protein
MTFGSSDETPLPRGPTPEEVEILRRMTPARKLAVMTGLIRQAFELLAAGIRPARPSSRMKR